MNMLNLLSLSNAKELIFFFLIHWGSVDLSYPCTVRKWSSCQSLASHFHNPFGCKQFERDSLDCHICRMSSCLRGHRCLTGLGPAKEWWASSNKLTKGDELLITRTPSCALQCQYKLSRMIKTEKYHPLQRQYNFCKWNHLLR